jgi:osmotically-inducible protein OsmY
MPFSQAISQTVLNDAWLEGRLETVYLMDSSLSAMRIDTEIQSGEATLSGEVSSIFERELAGDVALGIDGINSVSNALVVNPALRTIPTELLADAQDAAISATISTKLLMSTSIDNSDIDIETNRKLVRLAGTVDSELERDIAEKIARETFSVEGIQNLLVVTR